MSRGKITKIAFLTAFVIGSLLFNLVQSFATLNVQPEGMELILDPNNVTSGVYTVTNESEDPAHVTVQPEPWPKTEANKNEPVDSWLSLSSKEFDLGGKEKKEVSYTIKPPVDHGGEISAMVFFGSSSGENDNIVVRNGVSIYVAFSDKMQLDCVITNVGIEKFFQKKDKEMVYRGIVFTIDYENKGNVHLRPVGSVVIQGENGFKQEIAIERGFPAYIGGKGQCQVLWDKKDVTPGKYKAEIILDYGTLYKMDKKVHKTVTFKINKDGSVSFKGNEGDAKI